VGHEPLTNLKKITSLNALGGWDTEDLGENNLLDSFSNERGLLSKVSTLGNGTARDTCGWSESKQISNIDITKSLIKDGIYRASTPRGTCTLFKTLYTNACKSDCAYCVNSAHNKKVYSYTPHEVADIFHTLWGKRIVDGLFLSSAMGKDPETTMDVMIQSIEILRKKYAFRGYVHLKILPGVSHYQVERAVQLADRVSLNIEEPNASRLGEVCSVKDFSLDILKRQSWVRNLSSNLPSGQATQFMVGAADETDWEILSRIHYLYHEFQMRRIYYSAFKPVPYTRFQSRNATPSWREHRLYQVDWLHRVYHYPINEIHDALIDDFLPNVDPKITLAQLYIDKPVEVNEATKEELLKIPGIGPKSAKKIIETRKKRERIRSRKQRVKMGVVIERAQPFLRIDGSHQSTLKNWF
jgi:predicted DNA-binding helix-hairpin-helix protein